ncbi:LSU ribosomal protein L31P [Thermosipho atlanticus DSM 15807]|uniref:Large ribosomal subunit protein bL31 n=1 Tax=Thermosipho atlanticus DSM 15807 TaxID=1123380 RepID=A0A1M5QTR6_9BACT|nr:LSU ribosomal protein L31P [Thermosipho atlanticus DSM 15807]
MSLHKKFIWYNNNDKIIKICEVRKVKKGIHPEMKLITVKCACGTEHKFYSTRENVRIDVCSSCHPFYKGSRGAGAFVDTEGRIEKFKKKYNLD